MKIMYFLKKIKTRHVFLGLLLIVFVMATVYLDHIALLLIKLQLGPVVQGGVSVGDRVLFFTMLILFLYTWHTRRMANEMQTHTELSLKPILLLYMRSTGDIFRKDPLKKTEYNDQYRIEGTRHSKYGEGGCYKYLAVRNTGKGTAFNVNIKVHGDEQTYRPTPNFLAPEGDEQPFTTGRTLAQLNNLEFTLSAFSADEKRIKDEDPYKYSYRINPDQTIEFIG